MTDNLLDGDNVPVEADEGESFVIQCTFYDPTGVQFTKSAISSLEATLLNKTDNSVINSRDGQTVLDANGGVLDTDGTFNLTLSSLDNVLVDTTLSSEEHILILNWQWVDAQANTQDGIQKYLITVNNTQSADEDVPSVEETLALDLTGIKRVKTKHVEIETHNPKDVQTARDKENSTLPTFCGVPFCIGVPRSSRRFPQ